LPERKIIDVIIPDISEDFNTIVPPQGMIGSWYYDIETDQKYWKGLMASLTT
jgi:hypothetical protein